MPKVFIIILNFNNWLDTEKCLRSLEKVDYNNFEVVLIDNNSEKLPPLYSVIPGLTRNLKVTQITNGQNLGFAGGNNQGIKIALAPPAGGAGADYVLLLNNDTIVEPDFLTKLIEAGENNKQYGLFGPVIYDYQNRGKIQFAGGKINWSKIRGEHIINISSISSLRPRLGGGSNPADGSNNSGSPRAYGARDDTINTAYITGCCLLIKREVIEKIGLLSEDYFLYYEDTDWNLRAQRAGYRCGVVPAAKIYHKGSASSTEFSYPYIYYHTRNGLIFGSRFGFSPLVYFLSGWIFLKQLLKLLIGYKREWAKPVIHGIKDFWRGKTGKLEGWY